MPGQQLLLVLSFITSSRATTTRRLSEGTLNVQCDPERCVKATFSFLAARLECGSCTPEGSKWRCPAADGGNLYSRALEASFPGEGEGTWSLSQCVAHSYSPSFLAFSGPAAYSDHFVPACPTAEFCACDEVKDKLETLLYDREQLSRTEQNDLFWASLAPGFELFKGFTEVIGGSWEHFDLIYTHSDGRRQFCSNVESFTFSPQTRFDSRQLVHTPEQYETGCSFGGCDEGYTEVSSSYCWWPPVFSETCRVPHALVEKSTMPSHTEAADSAPEYGPYGDWSQCSKQCDGGVKTRTSECFKGSGQFVGTCEGPRREETECNEQQCRTYTTDCSWWSSCDSGFESTSWEWCSWGRTKSHCREKA